MAAACLYCEKFCPCMLGLDPRVAIEYDTRDVTFACRDMHSAGWHHDDNSTNKTDRLCCKCRQKRNNKREQVALDIINHTFKARQDRVRERVFFLDPPYDRYPRDCIYCGKLGARPSSGWYDGTTPLVCKACNAKFSNIRLCIFEQNK